MSQLSDTLPNGSTPLQLRGEVERAIEPYVTTQTFYTICAAVEAVFHRTFDAAAVQQQEAERQ